MSSATGPTTPASPARLGRANPHADTDSYDTPTPTPEPDPEETTTGPPTGFTLVDASDHTVLATLTGDITVELDDPASDDYAIQPTVNVAPYSLYGDQGSNTLSGGTLPTGSSTAYPEADGASNELGTLEVSFTVTERLPTPVPPTLSAGALENSAGVKLTWNTPAADADAVTGYEILRGVSACGMTTLVPDTPDQETSYTDGETPLAPPSVSSKVRFAPRWWGPNNQAAPQAQPTHGRHTQLWVYRSQGSSTRDIGEIAPRRWGSTAASAEPDREPLDCPTPVGVHPPIRARS